MLNFGISKDVKCLIDSNIPPQTHKKCWGSFSKSLDMDFEICLKGPHFKGLIIQAFWEVSIISCCKVNRHYEMYY